MQPSDLRTDIQGLRGVAVALVVLEHARLAFPGGFVGVDVFFVISGFVITTVIHRGVRGGTFSFREFWVRRANRLLPAAAVVTIATAAVTALFLSPFGTQQQASGTGAAAAVGLGNIALYGISADYFSEHVRSNPFLHTWSLGVEEQFYLVFPFVLFGALRLTRGRARTTIGILLALAGISFGVAMWFASSAVLPGVSSPGQFAFYMTPVRAWEFLAGAALALVTPRLRRARWHGAAALAGLAVIAVAAVSIPAGSTYPGLLTLLPVGGAVLVIAAGARANPVSRALTWTPLRGLGDVSYSLYLWHWPLLVLASRLWPGALWAVLVALAVALALALATHRFVEVPFRRTSLGTLVRRLRVPVLAVVASATACALVLAGSLTSWSNPATAAAGEQLLARPAGYDECLSTTLVSQRDLTACTWGPRDARPVYLLGDSNAQQYTEGVRAASNHLDRRLVVATWGGCAFVDVTFRRADAGTKGQECAEYVADTTRWLGAQERGTVVLAASSEIVLDSEVAFRDDDGAFVSDTPGRAKVWGERLGQQMRTLRHAGFDVVLVHTLPHIPGATRDWWHPVECQNTTVFRDPDDCAVSIPEGKVMQRQRPIRQAEITAISSAGTQSVDVTGDVCQDSTCSTFRDGTWLYRDGLHISPRYSEQLAPVFEDALRPR